MVTAAGVPVLLRCCIFSRLLQQIQLYFSRCGGVGSGIPPTFPPWNPNSFIWWVQQVLMIQHGAKPRPLKDIPLFLAYQDSEFVFHFPEIPPLASLATTIYQRNWKVPYLIWNINMGTLITGEGREGERPHYRGCCGWQLYVSGTGRQSFYCPILLRRSLSPPFMFGSNAPSKRPRRGGGGREWWW